MKFFSTFGILALCVAAVSAHSSMLYPAPRGHPQNPNAAVKDYDCITAPLNQGPTCKAKPFPCGGYAMDTQITQVFRAGDIINVKFWNSAFPNGPQTGSESNNQARHNGGLCEFALSYDGGQTYTVIATYHKTCPDIYFDWKVKIPDAAPSCDNPGKCIFSWTWINALGNREFYQNCADIKLIGTATAPLPIIDITRANLPPQFPEIMTPEGDPSNAGNAKGSGPSSSDVSDNMALNIGGSGGSGGKKTPTSKTTTTTAAAAETTTTAAAAETTTTAAATAAAAETTAAAAAAETTTTAAAAATTTSPSLVKPPKKKGGKKKGGRKIKKKGKKCRV
jgi:hypothetical protein